MIRRHGAVTPTQLPDLAARVWNGLDSRDDERMSVGAGDIVAVTVGRSTESFDLDDSLTSAELAAQLADRFQGILMEARREMMPACPHHAGAHPLVSTVVDDRAVWVCPSSNVVVKGVLASGD